MNDPTVFLNTDINITPHVSLSCRIIERYEAKNVIRKLFPQPGETSLANALRSALRPGEFKMTSMGRWLLVASLAECVDILWVSNMT